MKKIYLKPDIIIVDIRLTQLLSGSEPKIPLDTDPKKNIYKEEDVW